MQKWLTMSGDEGTLYIHRENMATVEICSVVVEGGGRVLVLSH